MKALIRFFKGPVVHLVTSLALTGTGLFEIAEMVAESAHEVGTAHGLAIFGLAQVFKAVSEIAEGFQSSGELLREQQARKGEQI